MPAKRLTEPGIERLKAAPNGKRVEFFDTHMPGLVLRVTDKGAKSWCVYFYDDHGRHRRHTFGRWPHIRLPRARELAAEAKGAVQDGFAPDHHEQERQRANKRERANTFRAVAEKFMEEHAAGLRSRKAMQARLDNDILPVWGDRPIRDITRSDVRALLQNKARKHPTAANRCLALVRTIFNFAIDEEIVGASPVVRIKPPGEERERDRVLSDNELARLWAGFDKLGAPYGPIFKLLLLTGQRRNEVAGLRWSEIDGDTWRLEADRSKAGTGHLVPLSALAKEAIACVDRGTAMLFASRGVEGRHVAGWDQAKRRLDNMVAKTAAKASGEDLDMAKHAIPDWRLHDLRRSFATGLRSLGVDRLTVSKCLNHTEAGITKVYDRYAADPEKRRAMDAWSRHIEALIGRAPANVVKFRAS